MTSLKERLLWVVLRLISPFGPKMRWLLRSSSARGVSRFLQRQSKLVRRVVSRKGVLPKPTLLKRLVDQLLLCGDLHYHFQQDTLARDCHLQAENLLLKAVGFYGVGEFLELYSAYCLGTNQSKLFLEKTRALAPSARSKKLELLTVEHLVAASDYSSAFKLFREIAPSFTGRDNLVYLNWLSGDFRAIWANYELYHMGSPTNLLPLDMDLKSGFSGRLLIKAVGGIGDELRYISCYHDIIGAVPQTAFTCDARLKSILEYNFPQTVFLASSRKYRNGMRSLGTDDALEPVWDWVTNNIAILVHFRAHREDFGSFRALRVPPDTKVWLPSAGEGKLRVGICWRSGIQAYDRNRYHYQIEEMVSWFGSEDVALYSLVYNDYELRGPAEKPEGRVLRVEGLDIKDDFVGLGHFLASLDLVVSVPSTVGEYAGMLGCPTLMVSPGDDVSLAYRVNSDGTDLFFPAMKHLRTGALSREAIQSAVAALLSSRAP